MGRFEFMSDQCFLLLRWERERGCRLLVSDVEIGHLASMSRVVPGSDRCGGV